MPVLPTFDPSVYPRIYRIRAGWSIFLVLLGIVCAGGGLVGTWYFGSGHETQGLGQTALGASLCFLFVLLGAYLAVDTLRSKVIVSVDAIEIHDLWPTRRLRREEIAGRRVMRAHNAPPTLVLIPQRPNQKKLKLPQIVQTDAAFEAWLATIRDLDAEELRNSEAQIAVDLNLGLTPEERADRLARARRLARGLNVTAPAILLWGFLYPYPYDFVVAVLSILPLFAIGLVVRSRGLYRINELPNDAHPNLTAPVIGPGLVLAVRAIADIHVVNWLEVLAPTALGGLAITLMLARADGTLRERRTTLPIYLVFMGAYAYGVALQGNARLDRSPPEVFKVTVESKSVSPGNHPSWQLRLGPWGVRPEAADVIVSHALYDAVTPGDTVCVQARPGMLGIAWYLVTTCGGAKA